MPAISPEVLSAAVDAVKISPAKPANADYDEQAARAQNNGKLMSESDVYKFQQSQFNQPVLIRRQVLDANNKVLAEAVLISAGAVGMKVFNDDIAVAVNDKDLKLTVENNDIRVTGRDNIKIVDVNVKSGEKTERQKLFDEQELVTEAGKPKIASIMLHTPTDGGEITLGDKVPGTKLEVSRGPANLILKQKNNQALPVVTIRDAQASHSVTVDNLSAQPAEGGNPVKIGVRPTFIATNKGFLNGARLSESGGHVDISIPPSANAAIHFKHDNRKPVSLVLYKDGQQAEAFNADPANPASAKSMDNLRVNLNKAFKDSATADFENRQLPSKPQAQQRLR